MPILCFIRIEQVSWGLLACIQEREIYSKMVFPRIIFEKSWRISVDRTTHKESPGLKEPNVLNLEGPMSHWIQLAIFIIHLRQINILWWSQPRVIELSLAYSKQLEVQDLWEHIYSINLQQYLQRIRLIHSGDGYNSQLDLDFPLECEDWLLCATDSYFVAIFWSSFVLLAEVDVLRKDDGVHDEELSLTSLQQSDQAGSVWVDAGAVHDSFKPDGKDVLL